MRFELFSNFTRKMYELQKLNIFGTRKMYIFLNAHKSV